ncbi:sensor histidine kinase [Kamptonema formosum]|uniref:sensor histidine kinase n=1 Tax=Kamptonema formosum TaxID=331992 RepID=UPI000347EDED|nr:PAS domain-containing sensor histidine kinase [Oscillatoria sp. PCC 10802]
MQYNKTAFYSASLEPGTDRHAHSVAPAILVKDDLAPLGEKKKICVLVVGEKGKVLGMFTERKAGELATSALWDSHQSEIPPEMAQPVTQEAAVGTEAINALRLLCCDRRLGAVRGAGKLVEKYYSGECFSLSREMAALPPAPVARREFLKAPEEGGWELALAMPSSIGSGCLIKGMSAESGDGLENPKCALNNCAGMVENGAPVRVWETQHHTAGAMATGTGEPVQPLERTRQNPEAVCQLLAENATDMISTSTAAGILLYVSPACRSLLGYESEELAGHSVCEFVHADDLRAIKAAHTALLRSGEPQTVSYRITRKDGECVWLETTSRTLQAAQTGEPVEIIGVSRDITRRKRAEEALRQSEARLESILNSLQDVVWSVAVHTGELVYLNPMAQTVYGRPTEEFFANPALWLDIIHPDDRHLAVSSWQQLLATGSKDIECRIFWPSGEVRWLRDRAWVVRDSSGEPVRIDGLTTDITQRVRMEEALRVQTAHATCLQARLQHLLSSSPVAIYSASASGDFATNFISASVTAMLGYQPRQFTEDASFWARHIHPEDAPGVLAAVSEIVERECHTFDYRFLHANGTYRWVRDSVRLIRDGNGNPLEFVGSRADITAQKQAEEEICKALTREKELSQLRARFITLTSHEFRTPLSAILSSADLLEFYLEKGAAHKHLKHVERIQTAALHMTEMLNDILVMGRAESGKLECHPVPVDLENICQELVEAAAVRNGSQHPISFVSRGDFTGACMDAQLLRYIFSNLLCNAIDYSPEGSPIHFQLIAQERALRCRQSARRDSAPGGGGFGNLKPGAEIGANPPVQAFPDTCHQEGEKVAIFRICDSGTGIPPEDLPRVFECFYRGSNVGNKPGAGLGLAIVKKSVEAHGGSITLKSHAGEGGLPRGTTVTVTLPLNFNC